MVLGQIIGGEYGELVVRQKSGQIIEIGDLLSIDDIILQVYDLAYGTLLEATDLARMSGMQLEGYEETALMEEEIRNFVTAKAKPLVHVKDGVPKIPKTLPGFFGTVNRADNDDFEFMEKPANSLYLGRVRSGSAVLDVPVNINGRDALSHHILIPATTGRGKSNLVKVMLWDMVLREWCGILVIDPHDEYFGRNEPGIKDHPDAVDKVLYYSPNPPKGGYSLRVNITLLRPWNLRGIIDVTEAQSQAMYVFYNHHGSNWLEAILTADPQGDNFGIQSITLEVIQRKLRLSLDIHTDGGEVRARGNIFVTQTTNDLIRDIADAMESGKKVILDTSSMSGDKELLIAGMITDEIFRRYKKYKEHGELDDKPTISVVIEEAPRVLGDRGGRNVFHTIAREGRKFRVGLIAITQLSSMIPREILANMNTKIILGNEMKSEREAIIGSAAQDLSKDGKNIASLDKGEAIVSSIFTKFAVPIKIDLFDDVVKREGIKKRKLEFIG